MSRSDAFPMRRAFTALTLLALAAACWLGCDGVDREAGLAPQPKTQARDRNVTVRGAPPLIPRARHVVKTGRVDREHGRVVDDAGVPVAGAQVWLVPGHHTRAVGNLAAAGIDDGRVPEDWARTTTDENGDFALSAERLRDLSEVSVSPSEEQPWLLVLHPGHAPMGVACEDTAGEPHRIVLTGDVARWLGRVIDEQGQPIAGARVQVSAWEDWQTTPREEWYGSARTTAGALEQLRRLLQEAVTDAQGAFAVEGQQATRSAARIEAPDGVLLHVPEVALDGGGSVTAGDLVMPRGGVVRGVVRSAAGAPLAGAGIVAVDGWTRPPGSHADLHAWKRVRQRDASVPGAQPAVRSARSAADGSFAVGGLSSPTVMLAVAATGCEPLLMPSVSVGAEPLTCTLLPLRELLLEVVRMEDGAPVGDARLAGGTSSPMYGFGPEPGEVMDVVPIEDASLASGVLRLRGACEAPLVVVLAGAGRATTAVALPGSAGRDGTPLRVELPAEGRLAGRVVDDAGSPRAGVFVTARTEGASAVESWLGLPVWAGPLVTAEDGSFDFSQLGAGAWRVNFECDGLPELQIETVLAKGEVRALGDIALPRTGSIVAEVRNLDGSPAGSVLIEALGPRSLSSRHLSVQSTPEGRVTLDDLAPGRWTLRAGGQHVKHDPWHVVEIDVQPGGTHAATLHAVHGTRVSGRVLFRGAPLAGAAIVARDVGGRGVVSREQWGASNPVCRSAADGGFEWEHVRNTPVEVKALAPWGGSSPPVFVAEGASVADVELALGTAVLAGRVVDAVDGSGLSGIEVRLVGPWTDALVTALRSDADGAFRFEGLSKGSYSLRCSADADAFGVVESGPCELSGTDQLTELRVPLEQAATIRGAVHLADGRLAHDGLPVLLGAPETSAILGVTRTRGGRFAFSGLAPGDYRVGMSAGPDPHYGGHWFADTAPVGTVSIAAGEARDVELQAAP